MYLLRGKGEGMSMDLSVNGDLRIDNTGALQISRFLELINN